MEWTDIGRAPANLHLRPTNQRNFHKANFCKHNFAQLFRRISLCLWYFIKLLGNPDRFCCFKGLYGKLVFSSSGCYQNLGKLRRHGVAKTEEKVFEKNDKAILCLVMTD